MNSDDNVAQLRAQAQQANIPITETMSIVVPGYIGKLKGAAQIACERGFIDLNGNLSNGRKMLMGGSSVKDAVTDVVTIDKATSVISILKQCTDF